jgi:ribosomal protein L37AE/L43A
MADDLKKDKVKVAAKADSECVCPTCKSQNLSHDGGNAECPFCGWKGKKADCK